MLHASVKVINLPHLPTTVQTVLPSLNVLHDCPDFCSCLDTSYARLHISIEDVEHANLLPYLDAASSFITQALESGGYVLVHCAAGISRSATASCHLMTTCCWFKTRVHSEGSILYTCAAAFPPIKQHSICHVCSYDCLKISSDTAYANTGMIHAYLCLRCLRLHTHVHHSWHMHCCCLLHGTVATRHKLYMPLLQVVAAHLMVTEQMTANEALESLRQKAPWVHPNPGFLHQLALFHDMNLRVDPSYGPYQTMMLSQRRQLATLNTRPLRKYVQVSCVAHSHFQTPHEVVSTDMMVRFSHE